jgi:hypothetical protein
MNSASGNRETKIEVNRIKQGKVLRGGGNSRNKEIKGGSE